MAFGEGETIPKRHTCDGDNISPPLSFADAPEETKGFAVIMEDLDSPLEDFVHWVIWGIPASMGILNENQDQNTQGTVIQGTNSDNEVGYYGPCPPDGEEHSYVFKVYALDENILDLREDSTKDDLQKRMKKHIVGKGELTGVYER
jgi:Raf kinase inhibitor-like YbhB/YbcL family protein